MACNIIDPESLILSRAWVYGLCGVSHVSHVPLCFMNILWFSFHLQDQAGMWNGYGCDYTYINVITTNTHGFISFSKEKSASSQDLHTSFTHTAETKLY